jgi:hypothetical protein
MTHGRTDRLKTLYPHNFIAWGIKIGWGHLKIFSRTTRPKKLRFTQKLPDKCIFKFVQIIVPRDWVGPQCGKPFLHVFILEKILIDSLYNYMDVAVLTLYITSFTLKYLSIMKVNVFS